MSSRDKLQRNVVRVTGVKVGTGFFIGNDGTLLTCFHILSDEATRDITEEEFTVTFKEQNYQAKCIYTSPDPNLLDIAILRLVDGDLPSRSTLLPLGEWRSQPNQTFGFSTFGFKSPEAFDGLFTEGKIRGRIKERAATALDIELLQLSSEPVGKEEIRPGLSGAPVYYEATGCIVGVITSRFRKKNVEIIPLAVPIETIAKVWFPLRERLREEKILRQLPDIIDGWFTEQALKTFYQELRKTVSDLEEYDKLGDDRSDALLGQIRRKGRVQDFVNYIRFKRPDIPLNDLIDLPSLHRVDFVNREDELQEVLGRYAPPFILFEAPAGYGKTELLKAIEHQHFQNGWLCIYVEIPEVNRAVDLIRLLITKAGYSYLTSLLPDIRRAGNLLATLLKKQVDSFGASGVILLLDNVERLPKSEVDVFLNHFLPAMQSEIQQIRIRLAGRYVGSFWAKQARELKLMIKPLTPFDFRSVRDTVKLKHPGQKQLDLRAAYLMHITGGHPGCMSRILEIMNFAQPVEENFIEHQDEYNEIVLPVAEKIRESIPQHLRDIFDNLSLFRRYNYRLLQRIIDAGIIEYEGDAINLERELTTTYLVTRKGGFIQDETARRLLAIRLRQEETERFINLCDECRQIYKQDLGESISRPEAVFIECLYQEIRLGYHQHGKTLAGRRGLSLFFAP